MTLKEGWAYHVADGNGAWVVTDPTMTALNKFGLLGSNDSSFISNKYSVNASYVKQVGNYDTSIHMGNTPNDGISINSGLINGIPLYWMLGKATESAGVFTISNLDGSARKPRIGIRQEIDARYYENYGVTASNLTLSYANNALWSNMNAIGMKNELSTDTSPSYGYISDVLTPFNVLTNMTWDNGVGTPVELKPTTFKTQMRQNLSPFMGEDGYYEEISEFAPIEAMHAMQFLGSEAEAAGMIADFHAKTSGTFTWKVKKASNPEHYIECTGTGNLIDETSVHGRGLETYYNFAIWCTSLSFEVKDGVDKTLGYQIA